MADTLARALTVNWRNLALGHDRLSLPGATLVRTPALPGIHDANFAFDVTAGSSGEIARLLEDVERELAHASHLVFRTDPYTPPAFLAELALRGYQRSDALVMLLTGEPAASGAAADIRPAETDADWEAFGELQGRNWAEVETRLGHATHDPEIGAGLAEAVRLKCPPVRYWLAWSGGEPVGFCSSWEGPGDVGQVENLFVRADHRHRGLGTALIAHCARDARAHGAGPVMLVCDPTDTPKRMYAALGFAPLGVCSHHALERESAG